jgi:hypothetical protein
VWLQALTDESATSVAQALITFCGTFGFPQAMQSDNGTGFVNSVIAKLCELAAIDKRRIASLNPAANGAAEKNVDIVKRTMLKLVAERNLSDWDLFLPLVQLQVNSRIASRHNQTPMSLMFAHAGPTSVQDCKGRFNGVNQRQPLSESQMMERNKAMLDVIFPILHEQVETKMTKQNERINNSRTIIDSLPEGSKVMIKDINRSNKVEPYFVGPYTIVQRKGNAYTMTDTTGTLLNRTVPIDQMKLIKSSATDETIEPAASTGRSWTVQQLVDHRRTASGQTQFRVRWKGFPASEDTWQIREDFDDEDFVRRYWLCQEAMQETNQNRRRLLPAGKARARYLREIEQIKAVKPPIK